MRAREFQTTIGGKALSAVFSDLASHAHGSIMLKMGETVVLATAVMSGHERPGADYFPLTVDFEERFYASGEILGSRFFRREGKPSDTAILSARIVDRTIRPLFDHRLRNETQLIITVLALGAEDPAVLAINAASLALATSDIPWAGPVAGVRVTKKKGAAEFVVDPPFNETDRELELLVCGKEGTIAMIEASAAEAPEAELGKGLELALASIAELEAFQKKIVQEIGKKKRAFVFPELGAAAQEAFAAHIAPKLSAAVFAGVPGHASIEALEEEWLSLAAASFPEEPARLVERAFEEAANRELHRGALEEDRRADGRRLDEIRPLYAQAGGFSAALHGTGLFYRGETHVLSVLTLGGPEAAQVIEGMEWKEKKRFMHHYNFPPFSAGETGKVGNTNRREIGHGALAEKALQPVLPGQRAFPYTIRLVSESMSSNGSTSMASVCAGSLALLDGGVPVTAPVAGVAVGLMYHDATRYKILLDIQGPEDSHGDMDFKVAGTRKGVTAIQLDIKVAGVPLAVIREALEVARRGRHTILEAIEGELKAPRAELAPSAPRVAVLTIGTDKIGLLIGPGGKTVNALKEATGVSEITVDNTGTVIIVGKNGSTEKALERVRALMEERRAERRP